VCGIPKFNITSTIMSNNKSSQNNLQYKKYYLTIDMCIWNNNYQITNININNQQLRNFMSSIIQ
jgi:hypothetical protein